MVPIYHCFGYTDATFPFQNQDHFLYTKEKQNQMRLLLRVLLIFIKGLQSWYLEGEKDIIDNWFSIICSVQLHFFISLLFEFQLV